MILPLHQISYHIPPPNVYTMEVYPLFDCSVHPQLPDIVDRHIIQSRPIEHRSLTVGMDLESTIVACQHCVAYDDDDW